MYLVRPVEFADIPALASLAAAATPWVHTLPKTLDRIEAAVHRSLASFSASVKAPGEESYVFVLESTLDKTILGSAAISAIAGANGTYFAFRNDLVHQVSRDLDISRNVQALTLCSELTAYSQLSSFYIRDWRDASVEAALLSRARLLFAAIAPHRFCDRFFVALAGVTDDQAASPFWDALGRKFFQMDFLQVESLIEGARNRTLIVELMPPYPVYVPLLPEDAQKVMGQTHHEGRLPLRLLTEEGFAQDEYVDIFDGGPILQAHKHALRSFSASFMCRVSIALSGQTAGDEASINHLLANTRQDGFRATALAIAPPDATGRIVLSPECAAALAVADGDNLLCVRAAC